MEKYFIEFASRAGEFLFRQPLASLPATVGRALSNDFIIDDPYVAAQHLRLERDDSTGEISVTDLGSRNGLFKNGRRVQSAKLLAGETVHFGHTTLRLRQISEAVAPEREDLFSSRVFSLPAAVALITAAVLSALISVPFEHFGEISAVMWLGAATASLTALIAWSSLWAIIGRVFAGRAQIVAHLAIAGWAFAAIFWGGLLCRVAGFSLGEPTLAQAEILTTGTAAVWALHRHLSLAQLRWPFLNFPLAIAVLAIPATFSGLEHWKREHRLLDSDTLSTLYDPALRLGGHQSLDAFMKDMPALRARADALRDTDTAADTDDEGDDDE